MAKTKPIGVRFDSELLEKLNTAGIANTPQKALILFERSYLELVNLKIQENNKPENKQRIESERAGTQNKPITAPKKEKQVNTPLPEENGKDGQQNEPQGGVLGSEEIERQIAAIEAEKCPKERDSPNGRKSWKFDQQKRISELKKLLQ